MSDFLISNSLFSVALVTFWAKPEFQKALFLKSLLTFPKDSSSYVQMVEWFLSEHYTKEMF